MCGFFGFVDFSGSITDQDHREVQKGSAIIDYRGPDDNKFTASKHICVGFRRLSILDIAAPSQPYLSEDKSILMMCNGEIYNYRELKNQLESAGHIFRTKTDSEVVLYGYKEWGESLWTKLNGIFAIVLWDEEKKNLYLVRDHLGVKPLHYMVVGDRVYFGSDYNSFLKQTKVKIEFNRDALLSYLSFRYVVGEQTFYKEIKDMLAGSCIAFSQGSRKQYSYWDIPVEEGEDHGWKYFIEGLDERIDKAVDQQLMSDVPLGAFISGGVDSSILLHYIAKRKKDIKTFITGFNEDGYNEFQYADIVAESLNITPRKLTLELDEYIESMDEAITYRGEPVSVPHEEAFLKMSRFLKKEITVVMSGEGADELFGGYGRIFRSPFDYYKQDNIYSVPLMQPVLSRIFGDTLPKKFTSPMDHFLWRYSWFTEDDKNKLLNMDCFSNRYFDEYSLAYVTTLFDKTPQGSYYRKMYYVLGKIHLANLLNRLDRMTMAASVEARVPFLDYKLVEFVSRMPDKYKLRWNSPLAKLKAMFSDSEGISEKLDTPKFILKRLAEGKIPSQIITRKKMGFPVPLDKWCGDKLKTKALELLADPNSKTKEFVNVSQLKKFLAIKDSNSKYDYYGKKIWMLMNVELWLRKTFP